MADTVEKLLALNASDLEEYKKHLMVGGGTPGPCLVEGKGVRVKDIDGNTYIDCTSQSWALYLGYCNDEIREAMNSQAKYLTHVHQGFNTRSRYMLAKRLADLAPGLLNRVSFTVGGGPAIEAAMKIGLKNQPGSKEFVCLWDSYHGTTIGSLGASWISTKASGKYTGAINFLPAINSFIRVPNPYCYRCYFDQEPSSCNLMCAKMLKLTLEKGVNGRPSGVILEPIQASAGQIPAPKRYLKEVRRICDEYEVPLIFDEIQTFCRIGEFFAAEHYDVVPDIIVLGKGLGGGLPIAAIIISDKLEGFSMNAEELHTFANNSLAQVTALTQLDIIERENVLLNTRKMGEYLKNGIEDMKKDIPEIGDIRAVGLHIGVEFVSDQETKKPLDDETIKLREEAMKMGAIFGLAGVRKNVLKVKPPLIINKDEGDEVLDILYKASKKIFGG